MGGGIEDFYRVTTGAGGNRDPQGALFNNKSFDMGGGVAPIINGALTKYKTSVGGGATTIENNGGNK